jgi:hypothetical protein
MQNNILTAGKMADNAACFCNHPKHNGLAPLVLTLGNSSFSQKKCICELLIILRIKIDYFPEQN